MCTHVWQKATTRSAERRPMSGLRTGNGRGKQKQKKKKINDRVSGLPIISYVSCATCRRRRRVRTCRRPGGGHVRSTTSLLPPARATLARRRGAPSGPRRARHRTTAPARGAMCCCWSVATPGRQQPAGMHAPTPYYVPTTRSRMHARTPVRAFFDRAPCAAHSHIPRRPVAARTHTYGTRLHVRTARACTYVRHALARTYDGIGTEVWWSPIEMESSGSQASNQAS
jgi:hypothetical protein